MRSEEGRVEPYLVEDSEANPFKIREILQGEGLLDRSMFLDANGARTECDLKERRGFYDFSLSTLFTKTPVVLIVDTRWNLVVSNCEETLSSIEDFGFELNERGRLNCSNMLMGEYLFLQLADLGEGKEICPKSGDGSFLVPNPKGWPVAVLVGEDQLDVPLFKEHRLATSEHVTMLFRNKGGSNPENSGKLDRLLKTVI